MTWVLSLGHSRELGYRNQNLLSSKRSKYPALNDPLVLLHRKYREKAFFSNLAIGFSGGVCVSVTFSDITAAGQFPGLVIGCM